MLFGNIGGFSDVALQIKQREVDSCLAIVRRHSARAAWTAGQCAIAVWKVKLPLARPDRLQFVAIVHEIRLVWTLCVRLACNERQDALAINLVFRERAAAGCT